MVSSEPCPLTWGFGSGKFARVCSAFFPGGGAGGAGRGCDGLLQTSCGSPRGWGCLSHSCCAPPVTACFLLQLNKTPSSSKKVTFGLNRNMTAGECGCRGRRPLPGSGALTGLEAESAPAELMGGQGGTLERDCLVEGDVKGPFPAAACLECFGHLGLSCIMGCRLWPPLSEYRASQPKRRDGF